MWELARSFNSMRDRLGEAMARINQDAQLLEAKVDERTRQLKEAHQRLLQADRLASLGQLAASVAHEINNPLSGVLNYSALMARILREDGVPRERVAEFRGYLDRVSEQTARAGRIVSDLLAFSRRSKPHRAPADLGCDRPHDGVARVAQAQAHVGGDGPAPRRGAAAAAVRRLAGPAGRAQPRHERRRGHARARARGGDGVRPACGPTGRRSRSRSRTTARASPRRRSRGSTTRSSPRRRRGAASASASRSCTGSSTRTAAPSTCGRRSARGRRSRSSCRWRPPYPRSEDRAGAVGRA